MYVLATDTVDDTARLVATAKACGEVTLVEADPQRAIDALVLVASQSPAPIVVAGGIVGNEIAARVAARLGSGVVVDVVSINPDGTAVQSIFGDTVTVVTAVGGECPVYAVKVSSVALPCDEERVHYASLPHVSPSTEPSILDPTIVSFTPSVQGKRPALTAAQIVVVGGRGVGETGMADLVEPLADALGAAVGVTRDVVDQGWYDAAYQVGQTGVTISPDLYIGLGVSGAIQHTSGMHTAKYIIAINTDEDAPIFQIADLSIVGDVTEIVPHLVEILSR